MRISTPIDNFIPKISAHLQEILIKLEFEIGIEIFGIGESFSASNEPCGQKFINSGQYFL